MLGAERPDRHYIMAADAYCVRLFDLKVDDVNMVRHSHAFGFGEMDLGKLKISEVTA